MKTLNKITKLASCVIMCMMLCACPTDHVVLIPLPVELKVELTYELECAEDLLQFVTPTMIYTDKDGQHELVLEKKDMLPIYRALCCSTENNTTTYQMFETEKSGTVPAPWIVINRSVAYQKSHMAKVDQLGIENSCIVKYKQKSNYSIEPEKEYDLSRKLDCIKGTASGGGLKTHNIYLSENTSVTIGGNILRKGDEVISYINELCSKNDTITMIVAETGEISKKENK